MGTYGNGRKNLISADKFLGACFGMKRQKLYRMPCSLLRGNSLAFLGLALILVGGSAACAQDQSPADAAAALGSAAAAQYGSTDAFNANIAQPATSGATPMQSLDGSASFAGQLSCSSSSQFLDVFVQPGPGGDLTLVRIDQDLGMTGKFNYSVTLPFPVSGVCANGIISCNPGTWANCSFYAWGIDSSGRASVNATGQSALGGCYCINNNCGNGLVWSDLGIILQDLGGGIVGAIQGSGREYAITNVQIDGTLIAYYGQDAASCSTIVQASGSNSPVQYYSPQSDAALMGAASNLVTIDSATPGSFYNMVSTSAAAQNSIANAQSCTIGHQVSVTTRYNCPAGSAYDPGSNYCIIGVSSYTPQTFATGGGTNGCYFSYNLSPNGGGSVQMSDGLCGDPGEGTVKNARVVYTCGGTQFIIYSAEYQAVTFPACPTGDAVFVQGYFYVSLANTIDCSYYPGFSPLGSSACAIAPQPVDTISDTIVDQCTAFEGDSDCRLASETVDSVVTIVNYTPTNLVPLPTCRTFTGASTHNICEDFWLKERLYLCSTQQSFDFSNLESRTSQVNASVSGDTSSGNFQYSDLGQTNPISVSADLSTPANTCTQACKTRKAAADTQVGLTAKATDYQANPTTYDFYYYQCQGGQCPAGAGETIIMDCQCINEFAEAATVQILLDNAGKDTICSSGQKQ